MTKAEIATSFVGKRIAAVDYGLRRVGFAVCDESHIVVSPRGFFENHPLSVGKVARWQPPTQEESLGDACEDAYRDASNQASNQARQEERTRPALPMYPAERLWNALLPALECERVCAVVVGVPYRTDGLSTALIEHIHRFCEELRTRTQLPVFEIDESFSSNRAVQAMMSTGASRKKRARKGTTDAVAAALLLRDFLEEYRVP
jgi:putative Holliday junction resolvase